MSVLASRLRLFFLIAFSLAGFILLLTIALTLPLRWLNPPITAFVLQDDYVNDLNLRRNWQRYDDISPEIFLALIAAEDQKFPEHFGFDFDSLQKALASKSGKRRGASTITQQLVKNLYLWPGRSVFRKGLEAWLTLWVELFLPKKRILELYVNVIEFGRGIYGIGHATRSFYESTPAQMNRFQASMLAAVLPSPKRYTILKPTSYLFERSADIRKSMRALGGVGFLQEIK